jgi:hypothetical protein
MLSAAGLLLGFFVNSVQERVRGLLDLLRFRNVLDATSGLALGQERRPARVLDGAGVQAPAGSDARRVDRRDG